jgi:hypothetical protein
MNAHCEGDRSRDGIRETWYALSPRAKASPMAMRFEKAITDIDKASVVSLRQERLTIEERAELRRLVAKAQSVDDGNLEASQTPTISLQGEKEFKHLESFDTRSTGGRPSKASKMARRLRRKAPSGALEAVRSTMSYALHFSPPSARR